MSGWVSDGESSFIAVPLPAQWSLPSHSVLLTGLDKDCRLTEPLGMRIAEFPLNPMFAKMLLESGGWSLTAPFDFILISRELNFVHRRKRDQLLFKK